MCSQRLIRSFYISCKYDIFVIIDVRGRNTRRLSKPETSAGKFENLRNTTTNQTWYLYQNKSDGAEKMCYQGKIKFLVCLRLDLHSDSSAGYSCSLSQSASSPIT